MKTNKAAESLGESERFISYLRFVVFFSAVFTICLDSLLYEAVSLFVIIADFSASNCMLLLFPEFSCKGCSSLWICKILLILYSLYYVSIIVFHGITDYLLFWKPYFQLDFSIIALLIWLMVTKRDHSLMKKVPIIEYCSKMVSEGYYRFFCISFMMSVIVITLSVLKIGGFLEMILLSVIAVLMIILNVLFCMCDLGGYDTLATEKEILALKKFLGNTQGSCRISVSSDEKMHVLYERVTEYMDANKPFLNEGFEILDLASSVFSNKTYLSRTINAFSGQNFRQFVNGYRIRYAVRVLKDDPHLRMSEVADLCGFHNIVTFNMAFKLNMQETPTEWCQGYRASIRIGGVKHRYSQETSMSEA